MKPARIAISSLATLITAAAQTRAIPSINPPDAAWIAKIESAAPKTPTAQPTKPRHILVCSLATGYCHDVIPHVKVVMDTLAKTGAFKVTHSDDIAMFEPAKLATFDAVVLNNTCTKRDHRNWFMDVLAGEKSLTPEQRKQKAAELEKGLIEYVESGKGIIAVHGGIVFLNDSMAFSRMMGASFEKHPKIQEITLRMVEPEHPLLKAFNGKPFTHIDEPYLFINAYTEKNFRPLLEMDVEELDNKARKAAASDQRFVSWIRPQGKGRVFYVSPSHHPNTYERPEMLQYYLDGIQYALGDLKVDDSPMGK